MGMLESHGNKPGLQTECQILSTYAFPVKCCGICHLQVYTLGNHAESDPICSCQSMSSLRNPEDHSGSVNSVIKCL